MVDRCRRPSLTLPPPLDLRCPPAGEKRRAAAPPMDADRKARQRRIVERGADRLALITGQARFLPSDSPADAPIAAVPPSYDTSTGNDRPDVRSNGDQFKVSDVESDITEVAETGNATVAATARDELHQNRSTYENKIKRDTDDTAIQPDEATGAARRPLPDKKQQIFSPKQVSNALSATENIRLLSAIALAFLVVVASNGNNVGGVISGGIVRSRPLLVLLLLDAAIVCGFTVSLNSPNQSEGGNAAVRSKSNDDLSKIIDLAMLVKKAAGAFFTDCSICAVIMICFLRL